MLQKTKTKTPHLSGPRSAAARRFVRTLILQPGESSQPDGVLVEAIRCFDLFSQKFCLYLGVIVLWVSVWVHLFCLSFENEVSHGNLQLRLHPLAPQHDNILYL